MRVCLTKTKQRQLLLEFKYKNRLTWQEFAGFLNIKKGTLLTWYHEKNLLPYKIYCKIDKNKEYNGNILSIEKEQWGQSKGGKNSKGSLKCITLPEQSKELAEFIGIILGDGNIQEYIKNKKVRTYMVRITGDAVKDKNYLTEYVYNLSKNLFSVTPKFYYSKRNNGLYLIIHSKELVDFLKNTGLKAGNKIKNLPDIPDWILKNEVFLKSCLRGLIDTDGSIFRMSKKDSHLLRINFKNNNSILLKTVRNSFVQLGFEPSKITNGNTIYLSKKSSIESYLNSVGFSNNKHKDRLKQFKIAP